MKFFVVVALLVAAASAAPAGPPSDDKTAAVVRSNTDNIGVDKYSYEYGTSNGIEAREEGEVQNRGTENEGIEVRGQFSYVGPDGVTYNVEYTAGAGGFKPFGAHIPQ